MALVLNSNYYGISVRLLVLQEDESKLVFLLLDFDSFLSFEFQFFKSQPSDRHSSTLDCKQLERLQLAPLLLSGPCISEIAV